MANQPKYAKEYLDRVANIKAPGTDVENLSNLMRGTVGGALAGGLVGLAIAYNKKNQPAMGCLFGIDGRGRDYKSFDHQ
jgi:hypothetical protein